MPIPVHPRTGKVAAVSRGDDYFPYAMIELQSPLTILPPVVLYAETHFRFFRGFPSLLYRSYPEIIFDVPRRIAPGKDLPVFLFLNDIDRFPLDIIEVRIVVSAGPGTLRPFSFTDILKHRVEHPLATKCAVYRFDIFRSTIPAAGKLSVTASATVRKEGLVTRILSDNLLTSSKTSFTCILADTPFPAHESCTYGDVHVHSQFSQSHVEFGPPVAVLRCVTEVCGIDFIGVTDHSYDLACEPADYQKESKELAGWQSVKKEAGESPQKPIIILGEEISCMNARGKVVHVGGLGLKEFIPGSLDGARHLQFHNRQLTILETIDEIHNQNGIAFAAHPGAQSGFLQGIFLNRGFWSPDDIKENLDGFQAINSGLKHFWVSAKSLWLKKLRKGLKLTLLAGNDSHGDFNRYRSIGMPFFSIQESDSHYFAAFLTGVYGRHESQSELLCAIRDGKTFVTNGPCIGISASDSLSDCIVQKTETRLVSTDTLWLIADSSTEFGGIETVRLFCLYYGERKESLLFFKKFPATDYFQRIAVPAENILSGKGYIRAELVCQRGDSSRTFAFTSPCYF